MKTRIIKPKNIWYNKKFKGLSTPSKLVAIYLVTNINIALTEAYEQPDMEICFLLNISEPQLSKCKQELANAGLFYFDDEWVLVTNDFSYYGYSGNDNVEKAKDKEFALIPTKIKEVIKGLTTGQRPDIDNRIKIIDNSKGVVKGGKYSSLKNIIESDLEEISEKYNILLKDVKSKKMDLELYCEAKGKRYKNYKAALENWIRKDIATGVIKKIQKPTPTREVNRDKLKMLDSMKNKFKVKELGK